MSKNYTYSKETGQYECQDLTGLLQLLSESDKCSLKYLQRLEKLLFENSKRLRREDMKLFMIGDIERPGLLRLYPPTKLLSEVMDHACRQTIHSRSRSSVQIDHSLQHRKQ